MFDKFKNHRSSIIYSLFILLFIISPLYYKPNLGGTGLSLPYNITVWAAAITIIFCSFIFLLAQNKIIFVDRVWMILAFPVLIIISSFFSGYLSANEWLIRQFYIWGGVLFLIALFQFQLKKTELENILIFITISMIIHASISVFQILNFNLLKGIVPSKSGGSPSGILQQTNVQASYLATGVIISFYLIVSPFYQLKSKVKRTIIILAVFLSSYVVFNSGSRIGMLSILVGMFFLILGYKKEIIENKNILIFTMAALVLGVFLGRSGLGTAVEKGHDIVRGGYADLRLVIYSISIDIVKAEFIWGHGLASFIKVWGEHAPNFYASHPSVDHVPYIAHPHNELLLWAIETGTLGVIGIGLFIWKIISSLINSGRKNGLGYLAILTPISFHTQVELPFYISSLHWFLWLFLIFMVLNTAVKKSKQIPTFSIGSMIIISILYLVSIFFMYNSEMARRDLYQTIKKQNAITNGYPLQTALSSFYFQREAERLVMRRFFRTSIIKDEKDNVALYTEWAEQYILINPELKVLEDLSQSYAFLGFKQKKCEVVNAGLYMYEKSKVLSEYSEGC